MTATESSSAARPVDPDTLLKSLVVEELTWSPGVSSTHIGVAVVDGAVTLSGEVETYPEKRLAEKAVGRVAGVRAIAEEITVRSTYGRRNDTDIARDAGAALAQAVDIAAGAVSATVHDHVITLRGTVPWRYQRDAAHRAVRYVKGVREVRNEVRVHTPVSTTGIAQGIEGALVRRASFDARRCTVTADTAGAVTIEGVVGTWVERAEVAKVAWAAPGVMAVHNHLRVVD